jgi:hypothetical protein
MKLVMVTEYLLVAEGDRRKGSWDGTGDEGVIKIMDEADLDQERAAGKPGGVWVGSLVSLPAGKAKWAGGRGRPWWRRRARVRQGVRLWKCGEEGVDTPIAWKGRGRASANVGGMADGWEDGRSQTERRGGKTAKITQSPAQGFHMGPGPGSPTGWQAGFPGKRIREERPAYPSKVKQSVNGIKAQGTRGPIYGTVASGVGMSSSSWAPQA